MHGGTMFKRQTLLDAKGEFLLCDSHVAPGLAI